MKRIAKGSGIIAAALAVVLLLAGAGQAVVLFQADLADGAGATRFKGEKVTTDRGIGWRSGPAWEYPEEYDAVEYPVNPGGAIILNQGAIDLWVKRDRSGGPTFDDGITYNTLFSFLDADRNRLLVVYVLWDFRADHSVSGLFVDGGARDLAGRLWGGWIPFPRKVETGEWINLTFTWGPQGNQILLDGQDLSTALVSWDGLANQPKGVSPRDAAIADFIGTARYLVLGSDVEIGWRGSEKTEGGAYPLYNSVLGSFAILDSPEALSLEIASLDHDAYTVAGFSGALVEEDELTVTLEGTAGQAASFDIARRPTSRGEIALDWRGYYDELENAVALEDVDFYRVYASPTSFTLDDVAKYQLAADDKYLDLGPGVYRSIEQVGEIAGDDGIQTFLVTDLDPYLAYFVMVTAVDDDDSMVVSTVDVSGAAVEEWIDLEEVIIAPVGGLAMAEDADNPGIYSGMVTISGDLDYPEAVIVGHLGAVTAEAEDTFPIDTSVRILVSASPSNLKADEKSTSEIAVEVRNANGDTVTGHPVALSLTTTSEYTGVIGGGQFADEVGGELSLDFSGETDVFGTVTATFTAGFAAKTAVIVAKDLVTNDVGSGYVTQFIEGTTDIELIGLRPSAAKAAGYSVVVSSNRDWLTADGSSRANITAQVLQDGNPVSGHTIIFSVVGEGRVSVINAVTDSEGYARAVYTAGTRIGFVLIKATDVTVGISGSTQIELRSDAPAKVAFLVDVLDPVDPADSLGSGIPELYADGSSKAALEVLVTDINDNPNKDTEVDFSVAVGSGSLEDVISLTGEDGKAYATYVAGQIPGTVTVKVTVSSRPPTEAETAAAENAVLTVPDFEFISE